MDSQRFTAKDFIYDEKDRSCRCLAGNRLYRNGNNINVHNKRIAIVESMFGKLKNKGLDRFTLSGKKKVNTQWQLFSLVHNIEKIAMQELPTPCQCTVWHN